MNRLAFGDFAVTLKPIPNVVRGSEVQVTQMEVLHGKVQYNAVLFNSNGEFQNFIGPFPESAFGFRREPSPKEVADLIGLVSNGGPKTLGKNGKRHGWSCCCDKCVAL